MESSTAQIHPTASPDNALADARIKARNYRHPRDVVDDPDLSTSDKRSILAAWASDRSVVDPLPSLRRLCGTDSTADVDDVLDALCALDHEIRRPRSAGSWRRHGDMWLSGMTPRAGNRKPRLALIDGGKHVHDFE